MDIAKWDKDAGDYQRVFQGGMNEYNRKLMDFLIENRMLRPGCRVIDVGCGVGKYGTYFAALGCDVTLTDISSQMLRRAEENMRPFSVPWRTLQCDFNTISPDDAAFAGGFDLAISTMSPAIHDLETVQKLSAITHGWCFVTNFVSWQQPLRDKFYTALGLDPSESMVGSREDMDTLISAVSAAGYEPQLRCVPYDWLDIRSPREAAEYLIKRHSAMDEQDEDLLAKAEAVAAGLCNGRGEFEDAVHTQVAWLYWRSKK